MIPDITLGERHWRGGEHCQSVRTDKPPRRRIERDLGGGDIQRESHQTSKVYGYKIQ